MGSTVAQWAGRWDSDLVADAFERFLEELVGAAPAHIRITRAALVEERVLLSRRLVDSLGEPELVAAAVNGDLVQQGTFAGCVALDRVRLRGYEIGLFTGRELARCSFRALDTPASRATHGVLVDAPDEDRCLSVPTVVLRYFLEGWVEELLAATRMVFMPDLAYFVRGSGSGDDDFARSVPAFVRCDLRGGTPPPRHVLEYLVQRLAARAREEAAPMADFDAMESRAAAFPNELRARGLSDDDVSFALQAGVTPDFLDDVLASSAWANLSEFVAHLREQRAVQDVAFGDLSAILDPSSWRTDDEAN